jgi:predicted ATPase
MTIGISSSARNQSPNERPARSSFTSLSAERDKSSVRLPSSTGGSSGGEGHRARSSTSSGGDLAPQRHSVGSADSFRSPSASPTPLHPNNTGTAHHNSNAHATPHHRGSITSQRGSISSRVSSLTKDSSIRSLDPLKIEIADLTHMFGRSKEQELLQSAFLRALKPDSVDKKKELVVVHGKAGTGKTALVLDFKDAVSSTGTGYFCGGKFEKYQSFAAPFSGIVQALNDLCESISVGQDKEEPRFSLYESLGHAKLKELTKLLPKLETLLIGSSKRLYSGESDDESDEEKGDRGTERSKRNFWKDRIEELPRIFRDFLRALSQSSHPIILFLDDMQWADQDSIECISTLIRDPKLTNLVVLVTYRDDESCDIPFLSENHGQIVLTDIHLDNLPLSSVDDILSDLTGTPGVRDLATIVLEKTHGNPFSIFQFLEMLQRKELLVFSFQTHKWIWDVEQIKSKTEVTQNVGHSLVERVDKLSSDSRKLLTLAAVIGFAFEPKVVELIATHLELLETEYREHLTNTVKGVIQDAVSGGLIHPDQTQAVMATQMELVEEGSTTSLKHSFYEECVQAAIQEAEVEGLIGKAVSRSKYKFSHDLVHKCFYENTTLDIERHKLHLQIGRILRSFYAARPEDDLLFAAVDHLNKGRHFLDNDDERIDLIQLNQKSSENARARSALFSAANFSSKAIDLLKFEYDWMDHYDLLLHVYNDAAELNFACGRFDLSLRRCLEIHRHARNLKDKLAASYIRVEVLYSQNKIMEAINSCLSVLKSLGEPLDKKPSVFPIRAEWRKTRKMMKGVEPSSLLSLQPMQDPIKRQTQRYLSLLVKISFNAINDQMLPMAILRMFQNALIYGACDSTPCSIAGYGSLCAAMGTFDEAVNYGNLAIQMCERMGSEICIPSTYSIVYSTLHHVRNPLLEGIEPLLKGYRCGVGNGEVQYAASCAAISASMGFHCALPLKAYTEDLKSVCDQLKLLKQESSWALVIPYWRAAMNLSGTGSRDDRAMTQHSGLSQFSADNAGSVDGQNGEMVRIYHMVGYIVLYIFNDFEGASRTREKMHTKTWPKCSHFMGFFELCFSGLLDFALYREKGSWSALRRAKAVTKSMGKLVKEGAVNCNGMNLLLLAELKSLTRNVEECKRLYEAAMKSFSASGFFHLQAIANERLAEYMKKRNKPALTWQAYLRVATKLYAEWGAAAKVSQLIEVHQMPARFSIGETPCPVITIHGEQIRRFAPIEGHIKEEEFLSSDFISSDFISSEMLT